MNSLPPPSTHQHHHQQRQSNSSSSSSSSSSRKRKRSSLQHYSLVRTLADEITTSITLGAHPLVKKVIASSLKLISNTPDSLTTTTATTSSTTTTTSSSSSSSYLPDIDITSYLKYLRTAPKERAKAEDLERWRTDPIDLDELLLLPGNQSLNSHDSNPSSLASNPTPTAVSAAMQPLDSTTLQPDVVSNILEVNRRGILELKRLKDETALGCEHSAAIASNLAFGLRRRLLQLSFQVPKSEVTSRIQSTLPLSLPVSQTPNKQGRHPKSQQPSSSIATRSPTREISGISFSSAPPSDSLLADQSTSASTPEGLPRCANCMTTDTPGWRAGEKPEMRLCNACGLYWAKNNSHRPTELWGPGKIIRRPHDNRMA